SRHCSGCSSSLGQGGSGIGGRTPSGIDLDGERVHDVGDYGALGTGGSAAQRRPSPIWLEICCVEKRLSDIRYTPGCLLRVEKKASKRPSGLHAGEVLEPWPCVRRAMLRPSSFEATRS